MRKAKNCPLCATPGVIYTDAGFSDCLGCGMVPIRTLARHLVAGDEVSTAAFAATMLAYENGAFAKRMSFGEYLIMNRLRLEARHAL